ncbi:malate dehydrogenase, mitochondrial isoform X2 [Leptinotarsa decemlineata]|uniref:malate dehydrogenase, mitochondrial isoform X2 n=1 Tax=Leptinotarsa decemlineata TaxID=7539 RepID=UPI003D304E50
MIAPTVSDIFKKTAKSLFYVDIRHCSNSFRQKGYVVTVLDAYCKIGRYIALLLKQNPFIGELRLYDKNNNICAVAEDLSHIDTRTKIKSFGGKAVLKHAITDADIVVAVGGCKESHKETAKQLFEKNVDDVRMAALNMIEFNPKGVFCVSKPPIEGLVPVITEKCPGSVQQLIGNSEDDVLKLYADCGTVCLSPALAVSRFINTLLKAFKGETNCVECAFVRQTGHIGQFLPYMTSIVRLGRHGIMSSHMPKISGDEAALLKKAAIIIREHIRMGESFVTGEVVPPTEDTPAPAVSETTAEKSLRTVQKHV